MKYQYLLDELSAVVHDGYATHLFDDQIVEITPLPDECSDVKFKNHMPMRVAKSEAAFFAFAGGGIHLAYANYSASATYSVWRSTSSDFPILTISGSHAVEHLTQNTRPHEYTRPYKYTRPHKYQTPPPIRTATKEPLDIAFLVLIPLASMSCLLLLLIIVLQAAIQALK